MLRGEGRISGYMDQELLDSVMEVNKQLDIEENKAELPLKVSETSNLSMTSSSVKRSKGSSINSFDYSKSGLFTAFGTNAQGSGNMTGSQSAPTRGSLLSRSLVKLRKGDEYTRLKTDFIVEMRQLSKLRHPCITTVMGAVVSDTIYMHNKCVLVYFLLILTNNVN